MHILFDGGWIRKERWMYFIWQDREDSIFCISYLFIYLFLIKVFQDVFNIHAYIESVKQYIKSLHRSCGYSITFNLCSWALTAPFSVFSIFFLRWVCNYVSALQLKSLFSMLYSLAFVNSLLHFDDTSHFSSTPYTYLN